MLTPTKQHVESNTEFGTQVLYRGNDILGKNKVVDFFYDYWLKIEASGKLPSRQDIKPTEFTKFLDRIVLMDIIPHENNFQLIIKLIGGHVASYYGEISGQSVEAMENKDAAKRIYNTSRLVISEKQPIFSLTPGFCENRLFMEASALYLPLFDEASIVHKVMVSVDINSVNN